MMTVVERNNQTCRIKTFLRRFFLQELHAGLKLFFAAVLQELNQYFTNYEQKRCKNKV